MFFKLVTAAFVLLVVGSFLAVGCWLEKTSAPMRRYYIYERQRGQHRRWVGIQWARSSMEAVEKYLELAPRRYTPDGSKWLEAKEAPENE